MAVNSFDYNRISIENMLMKRYALNYLMPFNIKLNLLIITSVNFVLYSLYYAHKFSRFAGIYGYLTDYSMLFVILLTGLIFKDDGI